ncbi:hypothetical protein [Chelatococcus caeni]|uniref:hypothetical protein n=1 Tax=Chelatococcus caeni TaxID=1348468 RepID=UPI001FE8A024|nr:hypothetical protein [Chelatococcus caeni]
MQLHNISVAAGKPQLCVQILALGLKLCHTRRDVILFHRAVGKGVDEPLDRRVDFGKPPFDVGP